MSTSEPSYRCIFELDGFSYRGTPFRPCRSRYHLGCIRLGHPFRTRLPGGRGMSMPPLRIHPPFVCEACTVRVHLGRELTRSANDTELLMLERARMIDVANNLAASTWRGYQSSFRRFLDFQSRHPGITILRTTPLDHPSDSPAIPAAWSQQAHVLEKPRGHHPNSTEQVSFDTARKARSALTAWFRADLAVAYPEQVTKMDSSNRTVVVQKCIPSDELVYSMMSVGMSKRLGSGSEPPVAITAKQVLWQDQHCHRAYRDAPNDFARLEIATAGATNTGAWLSWLRGSELFGLDWEDATVTQPQHGPVLGLEVGNGAIGLRLLPETKTNRTSRVDQYVSYHSASGLSLGVWLDRLDDLHTRLFGQTTGPIFRSFSGERWTSTYFRHTYLYPWLNQQRLEGDPMLQKFDPASERDSIPARFYSMGSYRRGGRSHVAKKRPGCVRKATPAEVYEHGRWSIRTGTEAAPIHYNEPSVPDKLDITLLCM